MDLRVAIVAFAVPLAAFAVPAGAQAATHSPLDPVRLAADFAPGPPALPSVRPFEEPVATAAVDSAAAAADSPAPASPPFASPASIGANPQPSVVGPVAGALVGGAVGLYGGGAIGLALAGGHDSHSDEFDDIVAVVIGASIGEVLLMPAGAHLGNDSRGSYGAALGGSALGFAGAVALASLGPVGAIAGVGLQTLLTVSAERRAARRRALPASAASVTLP